MEVYYFNIVNILLLLYVVDFCASSRCEHDPKCQDDIRVSTCSRKSEEAVLKQYLLENLRPNFVSLLSKETDKLDEILENVQTKLDQAETNDKNIKIMASKVNYFEDVERRLRERISELDVIQERLTNFTLVKKCPNSSWKLYENVCYLFVPDRLVNWEEAKDNCRRSARNGQLVTITSAGINEFLRIHGNAKRYWTAGNDIASEGVWKWYPDNRLYDYTNWSSSEPNNVGNSGNGDCMTIYLDYNNWRDKNCRLDKFGYICQHLLVPSQ